MKSFQSLEEYKDAALRLASVEPMEGGKTHFAKIPGFEGVWAQGATVAAAKRELGKVLDGWIELRLEHSLKLPSIKGVKPPAIHFA